MPRDIKKLSAVLIENCSWYAGTNPREVEEQGIEKILDNIGGEICDDIADLNRCVKESDYGNLERIINKLEQLLDKYKRINEALQ